MVLLGIDVSGAQGSIDFHKVKASGVAFVIAKVTEGHTFLDSYYWANKNAIKAAGLVPGAYHFLRPGNGAPTAAQADWFCKWADPDAIHALDVEGAGPLDVAGWVTAYRQHYPKKTLLIYTGPYMWKHISKVDYDGAQFGPLWAAGYKPNRYVSAHGSLEAQWKTVTGNCDLPWLGWSEWKIMQFTDHAQVPGVSGGVDGNAFGGTLDDLKKLASRSQEDDHMSAQDVADLKAYLDDQVQALTKTLSDMVEKKLDQNLRAYFAEDWVHNPTMSVANGGTIVGKPETDKDGHQWTAFRVSPLDMVNEVFKKVVHPPIVDSAVLEAAVTAALQATGAQAATVEQVRAVLVSVLEGTRLSAAPPSA